MNEESTVLELATIRKNRGITLEQIATVTKIGVRTLKAIERGEFRKLPGGIYDTELYPPVRARHRLRRGRRFWPSTAAHDPRRRPCSPPAGFSPASARRRARNLFVAQGNRRAHAGSAIRGRNAAAIAVTASTKQAPVRTSQSKAFTP